jgi:hypothetical protein
MKKAIIISLMMLFTSSVVSAHDYVDQMAYRQIANINAQERADVMHELREGDFREAQQIIQYDEAVKNEIRREKAMYDRARYRNHFGYGYSRW